MSEVTALLAGANPDAGLLAAAPYARKRTSGSIWCCFLIRTIDDADAGFVGNADPTSKFVVSSLSLPSIIFFKYIFIFIFLCENHWKTTTTTGHAARVRVRTLGGTVRSVMEI